MSILKEITGSDRHNNEIMRLENLVPIPPLDQIYTITLTDQNGRPYVFTLLKNKPEPELNKLDETIVYENLSIDFNDIKKIFMILTDDQRNIVMHIYYMYKNNKKNMKKNDIGEVCEYNPKIILHGPAGTGKSTIITFIEKLITWEENLTSDSPQKIKVLKCAFTGKAASNIDGVTLHSMFSISIYNTRNLNKKRLESKKELLEDGIFFICDEISLVGAELMNSVNRRLQQIFENDKLYGDRFVLLVGDLYQIDPVLQKRIYPKSELWTCCEFYELTKIIRQQDENFINALNNFKYSQMTEEDINLLRSREIQNIDQVPDSVIHLFYRNEDVITYNIAKLNRSTGQEETVNYLDDKDWQPSNLRVKIGIRYMITYNMDVGDGLANGTTGVVKGFDYDTNGSVVVIWMEFDSMRIGRKTRSEYFKKYSKPGFENWVPIHRSNIVVELKINPKVSRTVGNMFPLKAAEAITVHKSQGQTYHDGVCIHITDHSYDKLRTDKTLQYVALTRVKRLEDLYIMGNLYFSNENSKKFIRAEDELKRLRTERKLKLAYETFEDKTCDVIIFLNTGLTFKEHYQFVTTDTWYDNGSLLIFTETNTMGLEEIVIPNFEIAFQSDEIAARSGGGIICYKKASKSVEFLNSMSDYKNKMNLTLLLYETYLYIVTGVKGDSSDDDFIFAILKFISQYIRDEKCILFVGNFNPNIILSLEKIINDMDFGKKLSYNVLDANEEGQCNIVFNANFNIKQDDFGSYEYVPSSHRPTYVKLPPKSELPEGHGEVHTVDYEKSDILQEYKGEEAMEVE